MSSHFTQYLLSWCLLFLIPGSGDLTKRSSLSKCSKTALKNPAPAVTYELAFSLMPNYAEPITYAEVSLHKGQIVAKKHINQQEFIAVATGNLSSKSNPEGTHLFLKYGIKMCKSKYDSLSGHYYGSCHVMDQLWKLRHQTKPGDFETEPTEASNVEEATTKERGWSNFKHAPDKSQLIKLNPFGVYRLNDFAVGSKAFALIKAANNPEWVRKY
jgi:hypothetical protein